MKPTLPKKRPILFASNSPVAGTGYGQQTAQLAQRLQRAGHPVAIASNYGHEGHISIWNGIRILPKGFDVWSNDVVAAHREMWSEENGADALVLTLFDVHVFGGPGWERIPNIISWVPIDHTPATGRVVEWLRRDNVTPVAMSMFGSRELAKAEVEHFYAPHALEKVFAPTPTVKRPDGSLLSGRGMMDFTPDDFVILMNAANKGRHPTRKSWDTNLMAVSLFMGSHPDARLYLHTERDGMMTGINLPRLLQAVGIPEEKVRFTGQYAYRMGLPQEALAAMYTGADVLLAASLGEGFGIPQLESLACGTPIVTSNWTACPELAEGGGWVVDGQPMWDPDQETWWVVPNVASTVDALEAAYAAPRGTSQEAVDFAAQYDADRVFTEHWKPILAGFAS